MTQAESVTKASPKSWVTTTASCCPGPRVRVAGLVMPVPATSCPDVAKARKVRLAVAVADMFTTAIPVRSLALLTTRGKAMLRPWAKSDGAAQARRASVRPVRTAAARSVIGIFLR
jgi:hypothetical protein